MLLLRVEVIVIPGTISQPWATWQKAFNTAIAGDTVYFRGGTWTPSIYGYVRLHPEDGIGYSGTSSNPICYFNYPGETPILDCRNIAPQYGNLNPALDIVSAAYIKFKGLTIRNLYGRTNPILAIAISATTCFNLSFENMIVHDISGRGYFYMSGAWRTGENGTDISLWENQADTLRFINCDAYNLCDSVSNDPGNAADGWWCAGYRDGYFSWYGCRAWFYTDDGIDSYGSQTRVIDHCWVMGTRKYLGVDVEAGFEGNGIKMAGCLYEPDGGEYKVIIRNSIAAYCNENEIATNPGSIGFYTNLYSGANGHNQQNALLYNNTSYNCATGFQDLVIESELPPEGRTSVFRNNITAYSTSSGFGYDPLYEVNIAYPSVYEESNNTWIATQLIGNVSWPGWIYNPAVTVTNADFVSVDSSQIRLPRKSNGSLPDITFLTLAEGSDLIDAGINVGLPYYGSAPDIGYSEVYGELNDTLGIVTHNGYLIKHGNYFISRGMTTTGGDIVETQIIADHTVVDKYDDIPLNWIDSVKKMWVSYAGESHSLNIGWGLVRLESIDPTYDVSYTSSGTPEGYTTSHLRESEAMWGDYANATGWLYEHGENDWWTNPTGIARVKSNLAYSEAQGLGLSALGFGWCWDATYNYTEGYDIPTVGVDPITGNRWWGMSLVTEWGDNGAWGIDDDDYAITGNDISMDDYLTATQEIIDYCTTNGIPTKVFFTTGPVDDAADNIIPEALYQGYLKFEHIRNYVAEHPDAILFDFADILCYNDAGELTTETWNGHIFPAISPENDQIQVYPYDHGVHIDMAGAVKLAKAMWWMLARIAGWDGN